MKFKQRFKKVTVQVAALVLIFAILIVLLTTGQSVKVRAAGVKTSTNITASSQVGSSPWTKSISDVDQRIALMPDGGIVVGGCDEPRDPSRLPFKSFSSDGNVGLKASVGDFGGRSNSLCSAGVGKDNTVYGLAMDRAGINSVVGYKQGTKPWISSPILETCGGSRVSPESFSQAFAGYDGNVYMLMQDYQGGACGSNNTLLKVQPNGSTSIKSLGSGMLDIVGTYAGGVIIQSQDAFRYIQYNGVELPPVNIIDSANSGPVVAYNFTGSVFVTTWQYSTSVCSKTGQTFYTTSFVRYSPSGAAFTYKWPTCWQVINAAATTDGSLAVVANDDIGHQRLVLLTPNPSNGKRVVLPNSYEYKNYAGTAYTFSYTKIQADINGNVMVARKYTWANGQTVYVGWEFTLYDQALDAIWSVTTNSLNAETGSQSLNFGVDVEFALTNGSLYVASYQCQDSGSSGCFTGTSTLYSIPARYLGYKYPEGAAFGIKSVAASCPSVMMFGVRGSGEDAFTYDGLGQTVDDVKNQLQAQIKTFGWMGVQYPAAKVDMLSVAYPANYHDSASEGIDFLWKLLANFFTDCSTSKMILVGYSQGADVVGHIVQVMPVVMQKRVAAIGLFGDTQFNPGQPQVDVAATKYENHDGIFASHFGLPARKIPTGLVAKTQSYCLKMDPVCGFTVYNALMCLKDGASCPHYHYVSGWTKVESDWIINVLKH